MSRRTFSVDGVEDVRRALAQLPKSQSRTAMRRVLRKAAKPMVAPARAAAPVDEGQLRDSIRVGTKLTPRQKGLHRREKMEAEVFFGPTDPKGFLVEFGTRHSEARPFLRPVWDAEREAVLERVRRGIMHEIGVQIARYERRMARRR